MKLLEYQAKKVLLKYNLPIPKGKMVAHPTEVPKALQELNLVKGVAKAQAFTGGRGKAGGIKLFNSPGEAADLTQKFMGLTLVTKQTGPKGTPVHSVLLEEASQIAKEVYVALTLDRAASSLLLIISPEGGMDIEEVAVSSPHRLRKIHLPFPQPLSQAIIKESFDFLELPASTYSEWEHTIQGLYKAYADSDASLLEINPLIVSGQGHLALLDCKFDIDDNALFRQYELGGDPLAELTPAEVEAKKWDLNYIQLDGNIGCMVNGAGLAMATMDTIQIFGGRPANFLDVGGSASEEAVKKAFEIITSDPHVDAILVNIFGGIMQCDKIARGILGAMRSINLKVPLVVRLSGTNSQEGKQIIDTSELTVISADTLADGAQKAVQAARKVA